jgi:hypothetical protein
MRQALILIFALSQTLAFGQQNYTLCGKISDAETGEDLIGVAVAATEIQKGAISNSYGFYSLSLPEGKYTITYSFLGYEKQEYVIVFDKNQSLNIELIPSVINLDEVVISAEKSDNKITSAQSGVEKLNIKDIRNIPVLFGEKDILKTIQLLPGISSPTEGSTGFIVRGGSPGQNLILLDEATVYSSSHLAGFFSVFNSDAIKDVTVYKGGVPANYGGRASSVLDITMNNGNSKAFSSTGGIGLVSSRLLFECPLVKDKMSFIISGRRTYGDLIAKLLFPEEIIRNDMEFYFYDLNAKINYTINEKNRLFLSGYFGKDIFKLGNNAGTGWGNTTGTIRWNHIFSDRLFTKTSMIFSKYKYEFILGSASLRLRFGIEDIGLKQDFTWYINPDNTVKFGIDFTYHKFNPGEISSADSTDFNIIMEDKRAPEGALYFQNDQKITSRLSANYGLRFSAFSQLGPGWFYQYDENNNLRDSTWFGSGEFAYPYFNLEPRLSANYMLDKKSSLKFAYSRMAQYLHLMSQNTPGAVSDIWLPTSNNLKPLIVDHFSAGYFRNFLNNGIETSVEVYYKNMTNSSDFEDGADLVLNQFVESQILTGKGRSYGFELFVKRNSGKLTGWVSYTLSGTENKIEGINDFNWYPMKYDKTHDISFVAMYKPGKRLTISGVWTYATGNAVTFPSGKYVVDNNSVPYYTERNGYRMPAYHRLDLSVTLDGKNRKKFKSSWDFSIYNVYNRYNAYMINFRQSTSVPGATEAVKLSLFGIVPSITYNYKF